MNKSIIYLKNSFLPILLIFLSTYGIGQQIDPAILNQLSPEQIKMVGEAYTLQNSTDITLDDIPLLEETTQPVSPAEDINKSQGKYGYDFFTTMATSTSAVGDLPLPNDYKISFRDQLSIVLSGSRDNMFDLSVKLDGTILFPELGAIYVVDKTLGQVKELLASLISQSYIGVQIDVSLKNLSAKKITIVGAVKTPGTYLVNPFSTITSALAYSGGISEIGTLRNIKLIRKNGDVFQFDLYELLINGDRTRDITIEAGDTILIDAAKQFVTLSGEVRRPAIYEVLETETIQDIVDFGLGFTEIANGSNLSLDVLDLESTSVLQKTVVNLSESIKNVLSVVVFKYGNENISPIEVVGAVEEPGFYNLSDNRTLQDLISNIKFNRVYPWLAVLEQFDRNNNIRSSILFNLNDQNSYRSVNLLPNSKITFFELNEKNPIDINLDQVESITKVRIREYFLKLNYKDLSYDFPIYGKYKVTDFIDVLGLDMSDVNEEAIYVSPLEDKIEKKNYSSMEYTAMKFSSVTLKAPVNDLISVNIAGAVLYPGRYTLDSDSTLQDLYNLAGEFKKNAFLDGIIYISTTQKRAQERSFFKAQETLKESLLVNAQKSESELDPNLFTFLLPEINKEFLGRVAGSFAPNSNQSNKTILGNNDSIFVPSNPNSVSVFGEVLNPLTIIFSKNLTVRDAIESAGGYGEFADKERIYIIKSNGSTSKIRRNIFVKNDILEAGDTVIVPREVLINSPLLETLAPVTQILSDIAFSAAAIENLSNN